VTFIPELVFYLVAAVSLNDILGVILMMFKLTKKIKLIKIKGLAIKAYKPNR
jgi:hypothetical protein